MKWKIDKIEFNADSIDELMSKASKTFGGGLQIWAGRWWAVSIEACPFIVKVKDRLAYISCCHPSMQAKENHEEDIKVLALWTKAFQIGQKHNNFWFGIPELTKNILQKTKPQKNKFQIIKGGKT